MLRLCIYALSPFRSFQSFFYYALLISNLLVSSLSSFRFYRTITLARTVSIYLVFLSSV